MVVSVMNEVLYPVRIGGIEITPVIDRDSIYRFRVSVRDLRGNMILDREEVEASTFEILSIEEYFRDLREFIEQRKAKPATS